MSNNFKTCNYCQQKLSLSSFWKKSGTHDGHDSRCIKCKKAIRKGTLARRAAPTLFFDGEQKECGRCGHIQPLIKFDRDRSNNTGYNSWCKRCKKELRGHLNGTYAPEFKRELADLLGGECSLCGYKTYLTAMQFHHVEPTKKETLISILLKRYNKVNSVILSELDKCCLLCANCHMALHSGEIKVKYSKRKCTGWNAHIPPTSTLN